MDLKDVTTATPVEIDTRLADLYRQEMRAAVPADAALVQIRRANGERKVQLTSRTSVWFVRAEDAIATARARGNDTVPGFAGSHTFADLVARYDEAAKQVADIKAQAEPLHAEFKRRGGWTRFFTVQNNGGHIHKSMQCRTCNRGQRPTDFEWNPELSGLSEADALARFDKRAHMLCTVCFPNAPLGWGAAGKKSNHCDGSRKAPIEGTVRRTGPRRYGDCQECTDRPLINDNGTVRAHKPGEPRKKTPEPAVDETTAADKERRFVEGLTDAQLRSRFRSYSPGTAAANPVKAAAALAELERRHAAAAAATTQAEEPAVEDAATAAAGETTTEPAAGVDLLPVPVPGAAAECRICRAVMTQAGPGGAWEAATPAAGHVHAPVQAVWADQWRARFHTDPVGALLALADEHAAKLCTLLPREADVERAAPPRAQLAAQLAAVFGDPDLLRAAADEITRARARVRIAAGPVVHAGRADTQHGTPRRNLDGALSFDPYGGDEWRLAGYACTSDIPEADTIAAQAWAAGVMAEGDYDTGPAEVLGWEHHRDAYGEWWEPITG